MKVKKCKEITIKIKKSDFNVNLILKELLEAGKVIFGDVFGNIDYEGHCNFHELKMIVERVMSDLFDETDDIQIKHTSLMQKLIVSLILQHLVSKSEKQQL